MNEQEYKSEIRRLKTQATKDRKKLEKNCHSIISFLRRKDIPRNKIIDYINEYILQEL